MLAGSGFASAVQARMRREKLSMTACRWTLKPSSSLMIAEFICRDETHLRKYPMT